jgi:ZZ-type zinc finger-containing protein 3
VAARRWQKIARALGNRTPKQVASRVQKYFVKLALENKAIPGGGKPPPTGVITQHMRKQAERREKREQQAAQREHRLMYPVPRRGFNPSPGMYYRAPAVYMSDDDDSTDNNGPEMQDFDDEIKNSPEYLELLQLTKLKKKQQPPSLQTTNRNEEVVRIVHEGYAVRPFRDAMFRAKACVLTV